MVDLKLLNGKAAGTVQAVRRFPVQLGRAAAAPVRLLEDGVWEEHAEIYLHQNRELVLKAKPPASVLLNSVPVTQAVLRNGDLIDLGGARLRFSLSAPVPKSLKGRETLTWLGLGALFAVQVALIYWLLNQGGLG